MTGFKQLSRNRDFTTLWIGETVNELGSRMSMFVFPLLAYTISGSALIAALVEGTFLFGLIATLLPAGALVDRLNRRALMIGASATGLVLYGSLAVAGIFWHLTIPHLAIVGLLAGAAAGIFEPAQMSAIRTVVSTEELPTALSQNQARQHVASLLGAPLGGLLYAFARWVPFAANAVSFAISCFTVSRIRTDLSAKPSTQPRGRIRARHRRGHPVRHGATVLPDLGVVGIVRQPDGQRDLLRRAAPDAGRRIPAQPDRPRGDRRRHRRHPRCHCRSPADRCRADRTTVGADQLEPRAPGAAA